MPSDRAYKIMILTDSSANPRSFPASMVVTLEETYPYLLRDEFAGSTFYQLSFGNITTEDLVSQAMSYLTHWKPDFIIVQSGLADCKPEAFTQAEKAVINRLPGRLLGKLKKYLYHPVLIRHRQLFRVSEPSFRKTLKKFKFVFSKSKIHWLEICAASSYESDRPGIIRRVAAFNKIIEEVYGDSMVRLQDKVLELDGLNADSVHWRSSGHRLAADMLIDKINQLR
jgi:hypothetical protein